MRIHFEDRSLSARTASKGRAIEIVPAIQEQTGIRHRAILSDESLQRSLLISSAVKSQHVDDSSAILPTSRRRAVDICGRIDNHTTIGLRSVIAKGVQNLLGVLPCAALYQLVNDSQIIFATGYGRSVDIASGIQKWGPIWRRSLKLCRECEQRCHEPATATIGLKFKNGGVRCTVEISGCIHGQSCERRGNAENHLLGPGAVARGAQFKYRSVASATTVIGSAIEIALRINDQAVNGILRVR